MKLETFIAESIVKLRAQKIETPELDARLLIGYSLGLDRAELLSQSDRLLEKEEIANLQDILARRLKHESVSRIKGMREFWGLDFHLNEATLEPRPDSETVIETILKANISPQTILDMGTGTGCLLLSLLVEFQEAKGLGIDLNPRAIEEAQHNADHLQLKKRASFKVSDWFSDVAGTFDLIVSNPPYIESSALPFLMPEVRDHDPSLALDGGEDGLSAYRNIIPKLSSFLNPGGAVVFEIGHGQSEPIKSLFKQNNFSDIQVFNDLDGHERCCLGFYGRA